MCISIEWERKGSGSPWYISRLYFRMKGNVHFVSKLYLEIGEKGRKKTKF